ncbi:phosphoenolpyruvate--protein phosphotransferase [Streptomyces sp. NPDC093094]|uniref:phosphoenolpyruvate--protein phosphotransferase n=1 Tax=Streptomyces sp. NPDC093094 TaxID=3366026 RepID=UPI0037F98394
MSGYGVSPGLACAPVARLALPVTTDPDEAPGGNPAREVQRVRDALTQVAQQLTSAAAAGGVAGVILEAGAAMAQDPALLQAAAGYIGQGRPTAHSVTLAVDAYCRQLRELGGYMADRVTDLQDIRNRTVALLLGVPLPGIPRPGRPFVLVAHDLSPADTAGLADSDAVALLTEAGGPTGHTAILARILGLPAVVGCGEAAALTDGTPVILDGQSGTVEAHPPPERLRQALHQAEAGAHYQTRGPGRTADGHSVALLTNIGTAADAAKAATADAEGAGLFRTEFLFLDRRTAPTVEEQIEVYTTAFRHFAGRPITVRTLDAGSDKPLPFLKLPDEENPALGIRGLRTARLQPDALATQLTALAAAQRRTGAQLKVMAPMVSTPSEAAHFADLARSHGLDTVGVMIEIPAAALRASDIIKCVDFVSIGTNDLAQYVMAADRTNHAVADLLDLWQPAVLSLVALVGSAAADHWKPVGVCGEAAGDPALAAVLAGLKITSLSMAAPAVAAVRDQLARLTLHQCQDLASAAISAAGPDQARSAVQKAITRHP